jgi:hypothetical protein
MATTDGVPVQNLADVTISAKKIDDYTVEFTQKMKCTLTGQVKVVVAKDGKTHIATQTGTTAQGQPVNNTVVQEEQ